MRQTFLQRLLGIRPSPEELKEEIEWSNHLNYLDLKRKTEQDAAKYGLTVKEALLAGYPLPNMCRKHAEELEK